MRDRLQNLRYLQADMRHLRSIADRLDEEYTALMGWIEDIEDPLIRSVMRMRHEEGLEWRQIAFRLGGSSPDALRMLHSRYLAQEAEGPAGARGAAG